MRVDRAKFLLLAGALAASACVVEAADDDKDGGGGSGGSAGSSGSSGSAGADAAAGTGGTAGQGSGGMAGQGSGGMAGGSAGAAGAAGQGAGGMGGMGCDDSQGTPGDCTPVGSIGSCGSFGEGYCNTAKANLKPKLAEAAVTCMLNLTDTCGPPYDCLRNSLGAACPDSSADTECAQYTNDCSDVATEADCHKLIDGLNSTGRAAIKTCVEADSCQFGLWSCFEGL